MSSTHDRTHTPDGRYTLYHRSKDSFGDFSIDPPDESWDLIENRFGTGLVSWSNEGAHGEADATQSVRFTDDFTAVMEQEYGGATATIALPPVRELPARERELRAAIFADPDDDAPRTVLADYLLERADPRGELIALQLSARPDEARIAELVAHHRLAWLADDELPAADVFVRGFVAELRFHFLDLAPLEQLLATPAFSCVRELDMSFSRGELGIAHALASSPHARWLRSLDVTFCRLGDDDARVLAASPHLARLEAIVIDRISDVGRELLARRGWRVSAAGRR